MTRYSISRFFVCLALFLISVVSIHAENFTDYDFMYSFDLPEGYEIQNYTEDGRSYFITHPNIPVSLVVKVTAEEKTTSDKVLKKNLDKLKAKSDIQNFVWNEKKCAISSFTMNLDTEYSGWAVSGKLNTENNYITAICYCPITQEKYCQQFIMSTLNSLCIDFELYNTPGIIVSFAYPSGGQKNLSLKINNTKIQTAIDNVDEEASQFVIELEYGVLLLYAKMDSWKEAWQRYYRLIYRDSYGRIEKVADDVYKTLYPKAQKENPDNAEIKYAQYLLSWVQNFDYQRAAKKSDSDFTSLPATLCGVGNDCDSRSLLLCVMLKYIGIESVLLISQAYSHAMIATEIEAPGQVYYLEGTDKYFLYGETTAKVTWGMIAQDYSDPKKFIPVILP